MSKASSFPPSCGACIHCDQTISGFKRWCDVKKKYADAFDEHVCSAYVDIMQRDLFGVTELQKMQEKGLAKRN